MMKILLRDVSILLDDSRIARVGFVATGGDMGLVRGGQRRGIESAGTNQFSTLTISSFVPSSFTEVLNVAGFMVAFEYASVNCCPSN